VDRKIRLLAHNEYRLMEMLEEELGILEKAGKSIKMVTTNMVGTGYSAEVIYQ
jgi:hypothetical protein